MRMTKGASPVTLGTTSGLVYERVTPGSTPSVYAAVHTAFAVKTNPRAHNPNRSHRQPAVLIRAKYPGAVTNPASDGLRKTRRDYKDLALLLHYRESGFADATNFIASRAVMKFSQIPTTATSAYPPTVTGMHAHALEPWFPGEKYTRRPLIRALCVAVIMNPYPG